MLNIVVGVFIALHGLVHLLYFGQGTRLFELQPGMTWPNGSWAFSKLFGSGATGLLAGIACILAAILLAGGGAALILRQTWWRPVVVTAAVFSSVLFILFWDGTGQKLDAQGAVAILINAVILVSVLLFRWPSVER